MQQDYVFKVNFNVISLQIKCLKDHSNKKERKANKESKSKYKSYFV